LKNDPLENEQNRNRQVEIPGSVGGASLAADHSLPAVPPHAAGQCANRLSHRIPGAFSREFFAYCFMVVIGLLIFTLFWLQNLPTVDGWYATGRGLEYLRGHWFPYFWPASVREFARAMHPLSDLLWGLSFGLGGGFAVLGLLLVMQMALLACLIYVGRSRLRVGSALVCLALFLPGLNAPGSLPLGYLLLALWLLFGAPQRAALLLLVQAVWIFAAPFSWVLAWSGATKGNLPLAARFGSGLFGLAALSLDLVDLRSALLLPLATEGDRWMALDHLKIVYGLLLLFSLLGAVGMARWLSSERAATWDLLFGATRSILVGLLCADALLGWRVLFAGHAFAGRFDEHAAFAKLARTKAATTPSRTPTKEEQPAIVTSSAWVHAHALMEPDLRRMVLTEKGALAQSANATIWVGSPSPRLAARDLLEVLESLSRYPCQICGTVAVLESGQKDDREVLRGIFADVSSDPAAEACLTLAWFEARRQSFANLNRNRERQAALGAILDRAEWQIAQAFAQKRNESLAWAIKAEAGLIRFVLELEAGGMAPFVESFRLAQVCHDLRKSLALDPSDGRASNLLEDLLAKQNALDSALEWDAYKAKRRLGRDAGYSLAEWRVLDLSNELAFYRPLSEGKTLARLRDANRLGLKGLALEELSSSDPVLFGPAGIKLRMELMFSLGYAAEAAQLLSELKAVRLDRDLGLVEWPYARGKGVAATWKFPAMAWWEASAEAILDPPGSSSPKLNGLIGELQADRKELAKRLKDNFPLTAAAAALPQHGWMPAGYIAAQQWENEAELFLLGEQIGKQIQFLETLRRERQAYRQAAGPS